MNFLPTDETLNSLSDEQLTALVSDGVEDAFSVLVWRYTSMVEQQAARYHRVWLDADDLAQEGLLGLLSAVRTFRENGGASFATYATVCVRNRMLSAVKRAHAQWENTPDEHDVETVVDGQADPVQLLVERENAADLYSKLRELLTSLEYRVLLLYLSAYSYEEMAKELQVGTKTVDNALQRARRKVSAAFYH